MLRPDYVLHVRLLGSFAYRGSGSWCSGPPFKRGRELIQYLASYPRTLVSREKLALALWPEADGATVKHRLHLAVAGARAALRSTLPEIDALCCISGAYRFHPALQIDSDVERFLSAYREGSRSSLESAVAMYGGEYLAGEEAEWIYPLRVRCAMAYAASMEKLAQLSSAEDDHATALEYGLRLLEIDRAHEGASRLIMRSFAAMGRRGAAIAEYEALVEYLATHLAIRPSDETVATREEILRS